MRLFVGLDIPAEIRSRIRLYVEQLKARGAQARWTNPDGWHITLKFIGWTKRDAEIRKALSEISSSQFDVSFRGVDFFTPKKPRIFYAQVHAPQTLVDLAAQIDRALVPCGVASEEKQYSPHLTLARTGSGRPQGSKSDRHAPTMYSLKQLVESTPDLRQSDFGTMTANEFVLYLSELSPKGAKYTVLEKYPFR